MLIVDSNPLIWAFCDDRPGNVSQVLGVAKALKSNFLVKNISYDSFIKIPNFVARKFLVGITQKSIEGLVPPWPDIVVSAGRRSVRVALWVKSKSNAFLVHMMDPGFGVRSDFDLIVLPEHDKLFFNLPNVIRTIGASYDVVQEEKIIHYQWKERFSHFPKPWIGVLVGGNSKDFSFTEYYQKDFLEKISSFSSKGSVFVVTSRRTGIEFCNFLEKNLPENSFFYRWKAGDLEHNPYQALISLNDSLIVTGDSISMICEACSGLNPVYIYAPKDAFSKKHQAFHQTIFKYSYAKSLDEGYNTWSHPRLNDAAFIAEQVNKKFQDYKNGIR